MASQVRSGSHELQRYTAGVAFEKRQPPRMAAQRFEILRIIPHTLLDVIDGDNQILPGQDGIDLIVTVLVGAGCANEARPVVPLAGVLSEHDDGPVRDRSALAIGDPAAEFRQAIRQYDLNARKLLTPPPL